jgi:hypothetical protein
MADLAENLATDGSPVPGGLGVVQQTRQVQNDATGNMPAEVGGNGVAEGMRRARETSSMNHARLAAPILWWASFHNVGPSSSDFRKPDDEE